MVAGAVTRTEPGGGWVKILREPAPAIFCSVLATAPISGPTIGSLDSLTDKRLLRDMHTLTVTAARAQLGHWLARAVRGEEIGVVVGAQVVALRPVPIQAADYMETEYGLSREEADRVATRMRAETQIAKAKGELLGLDELEGSLSHAASRRRQKHPRRAGKART